MKTFLLMLAEKIKTLLTKKSCSGCECGNEKAPGQSCGDKQDTITPSHMKNPGIGKVKG